MGSSSQIRKPLIVSHLSSEIQSRYRQRVQGQSTMDGDGLVWKLEVVQRQRASGYDPEKLIWMVLMTLCCQGDSEEFIRTGTLDAEKDSRLVAILKRVGKPVMISLKPVIAEADTEEQALRKARGLLKGYLDKVRGRRLNIIKRKIICQMINKHGEFV